MVSKCFMALRPMLERMRFLKRMLQKRQKS